MESTLPRRVVEKLVGDHDRGWPVVRRKAVPAMKQRIGLIAALAGLALVSACARATSAGAALGSSSGSRSLEPTLPIPISPVYLSGDSAGPPTLVAPNPGRPINCSQVPYPGSEMAAENIHACWIVQPSGSEDLNKTEYFGGGVSAENSQQGLLIFVRQNDPNSQEVNDVPGNGGAVTVTLARWSFACYKTATGTFGEFDADSAAFATNPTTINADCSSASLP